MSGISPAGGVTSLNGQKGAVVTSDLYAIGSYVTGKTLNMTNYAVNATLAGSSLYSMPPGAAISNANTFVSENNAALAQTPPLVNVGTWRCVSPTSYEGGNGVTLCGLWVRIS